jgi:enoyl-CoA hydratase
MERVSIEAHGPVIVMTLDRPERKNALGNAMWSALGAAVDEVLERRPRAVVLTGAGAAFCAGMDVNPDNPQIAGIVEAVGKRDPAPVAAMLRSLHDVLDRLFALPMPIIAAVNGLAYGGGAELAARCDLRVMDPAATICFSEVRLGLMPDWGGGVALARLLGPARAADLILTARKVDAAEALALGLVNRVSAPGAARDEALALAAQIAENGPRAVRSALAVLRRANDLPAADAIALELDAATALIATGECQVGIAAFLSRTRPAFPD